MTKLEVTYLKNAGSLSDDFFPTFLISSYNCTSLALLSFRSTATISESFPCDEKVNLYCCLSKPLLYFKVFVF